MSIKLKPCPHCGSTDLQIDWNSVYECHFVRCYNCRMQGPEIYGMDKAAGCWNALPRPLRWTKESPTEHGLYWYRETKNSRGRIVSVYKIGRRCYMDPLDDDIFYDLPMYGQWAGPIQEPVEGCRTFFACWLTLQESPA